MILSTKRVNKRKKVKFTGFSLGIEEENDGERKQGKLKGLGMALWERLGVTEGGKS